MRIKFDPIIVFIFGLVAGLILSPLLGSKIANAQSLPLTQVGTSTFAINISAIDPLEPGAFNFIQIRRGVYPNAIDLIGGGTPGPNFGIRANLLPAFYTDCILVSSNIVNCDMEGVIRNISTKDSSYWIAFNGPPSDPISYQWYSMDRLNGVWSLNYTNVGNTPATTGFSKNTRFIDVSVTDATTTLDFDIEYFIDPLEVNRQVSALNPASIKIQWSLRPQNAISSRSFSIATTTGTTSDILNINKSEFPSDGFVDIAIRYSNTGCDLGFSDCPFVDSYIYLSLEMASGTIASVSNIENYDTVNVPIERESCSITNISACINNALIYLFVPSTDALNDFLLLGDDLDQVKPFGYFTRALDAIGGISTSTSAYTMPQIPFQESIFDPLRDGMSVMLWGVFAFVFYNKRLKNIDI